MSLATTASPSATDAAPASPPGPGPYAATAPSTPPGRWTLTRWLLGHTRSLLPALGGSVLARIAGLLLRVAILLIAARALLDAAAGEPQSLVTLALVIAVLSLVKAVLHYLEHYAGHWVAFTALERLRQLFFARLVPRSPAATSARASADLTERATNDIDRIEVFFAHTFPPVIASVVVPLVALVWFGAAVDARLAATIAVPLLLALLLPLVSARTTSGASREVAAQRGRVATHVADDVQGVREVLAFAAQGPRAEALSRRERELARSHARLGRIVSLRLVLDRMLWVAGLAALLFAGAPAAETVLAVVLMLGLWFGDAGTDDFATDLDAAFAACARVFRIIESPPVVLDAGTVRPAGGKAPEIVLAGVGFTYPGAPHAALRDVALRVEPGSWHFIAGVSGSGKSTIATLLMRSWDPGHGEVRFDGTPLPEFSLDALRATVSVLAQRPTLFEGTIASNVRLARPDASEPELHAALHTACLDPASFPHGLDTRVGERGTTLSGGQLQRIALARALVARPRVLVLDEALSQLDATTAATVRERIARDAAGATVIEITHRVDVIPDEGRVTVIDRGRVVEDGWAGDLKHGSGPFSRLLVRDA